MSASEHLLREAQQHFSARQFAAAMSLAQRVLAEEPTHPVATRIVGVSLRELGSAREAADILRQAVARHPQDAPLLCELGTTLAILNHHQEAFQYLREAGRIDPAMQVVFLNLGAVLYEQGHLEASLQVNERALALNSNCALAHYNKANALRELGRVAESIPEFDRALELNPGLPRAFYNRGLAHLLLGNFREGWRGFELREAAGEVILDKYSQPRWDGSPLGRRRLLVHAEQGIGDEILFATCVPDMARRAPGMVLTCDPRLAPLFARSFKGVHVQAHVRKRDCSPSPLPVPCDVQIPLGSLPSLLRPSWESFPRVAKLLTVDPGLLGRWQARLGELGPGLKVGISWRAGGHSLDRRKRSIPLVDWREILGTPGVRFVNLQYSDSADDIEQVQRQLGVKIHDWEEADPLIDMDSFAAKIAALDLVISVGNATVHLAGAVGTSAWTLLPRVPSWRWMISGDESPWYASVRLFRQPNPDDWHSVLAQIRDLLHRRLGLDTQASASPAGSKANSQAPAETRRGIPLSTLPAEIPEPQAWLGPEDVWGHVTDNMLNDPLAAADRHREAGEFDQAEAGYLQVLQVAPRQIVAHTGLGLVAMKTGRLPLALRSFRRALALADDAFDAHYHVAATLALSGRFEEAVVHYRRVIELAPGFRPGHLELGLALQRLGRHDEALYALRAARALAPEQFDSWLHEGHSLVRLYRVDEARTCFRRAADCQPECAAAWDELGTSYLQDQDFAQAEDCLRRALELAADSWSSWLQLGRALHGLGRLEEAKEAYQAAIALEPTHGEAYLELAALWQSLQHPAEALALLHIAAEGRPEDAAILQALGHALAGADRIGEALGVFARAIRFAPDDAGARMGRGLALLRQGNLEQAWRDYEYRWQLRDGARPRSFLKQPLWDGGPLSGQTILIHGEQGLAEELLFATCYPDVVEQAGHAIIVCSPKLAQLFARAFPQATIAPVLRGREHCWPGSQRKIDCQVAAGSLPRHVRSHAASFPRRTQLLSADPARVAAAQARLAALPAGRRVGLALGGQQPDQLAAALDAARRSWVATPGVQFVDVDYHPSIQQGCHSNLDDLAALLASLDLVIAVNGVALHLAGSLGVPTWALMTDSPLGPVWLATEQQQSLWYANVRIFRPQRLGCVEELAQQVLRELINPGPPAADSPSMGTIVGPHWHVAAASELMR